MWSDNYQRLVQSCPAALLLIESTTGAVKESTMRRLPEQESFTSGGHWHFFSSSSLGSVSPLVSWGDTWNLQRLHRQSNLLQDGISIRAIARRFAVSPSTISRQWRTFLEIDSNTVRAGQARRRSLSHQHGWCLLLCARRNRMSNARVLQNDL